MQIKDLQQFKDIYKKDLLVDHDLESYNIKYKGAKQN